MDGMSDSDSVTNASSFRTQQADCDDGRAESVATGQSANQII